MLKGNSIKKKYLIKYLKIDIKKNKIFSELKKLSKIIRMSKKHDKTLINTVIHKYVYK